MWEFMKLTKVILFVLWTSLKMGLILKEVPIEQNRIFFIIKAINLYF